MTSIDADFASERGSLMKECTNLLFSVLKTSLHCDDSVAREKAVANAEFDLVALAYRLEWFLEGQLREDFLKEIVNCCFRLSDPSLVLLVRAYGQTLHMDSLEKYVDERIVDSVFGLSDRRSDGDDALDMVGGALRDALRPLCGFVKHGWMAFADFASCVSQILLLYVIVGQTKDEKTIRSGVVRMFQLSFSTTKAIDELLAASVSFL